MKILLTLILTALPLIAISGPINKHEENQRERITQGIRSGELTQKEAKRLVNQQARIERKERAFKSDGVLTSKERTILKQDLKQSSQNIYRQKHDAQKRFKAK